MMASASSEWRRGAINSRAWAIFALLIRAAKSFNFGSLTAASSHYRQATHNIANLCIGWVPLKMNVPLLIDEPDISCFARTIMHPIGIGFVMPQALWKREHAPMDDTAVGQNLIGFLCMPHEWDQAQGNSYRAPSLAHGPVVHADLNGLALSIV